MESNMSTLKRRLNQAIGECRSQASVTARRLVKSGSRGSLAAAFGHSTGPTAAATATGAMGLARATVAPLGHSRHQHRPIYSYSFEELPDDYQQQQFSGAAPTIGADYHSSWTRIADGRAPSTGGGGDPLQVCQSQLFNGNEFKPNECHFRQTIQAKNQLRVTTSTTTTTKNMASQQNNLAHAHQQQQQTANITSHQEHYAALTSELVIEHHKLLANSSDNHHHPHQHHSHYDLNQSEFSIHDTSSIITSSQHGDNEHGHDLQSNLDDSQQYSRGEALNTTTDNHINDDANNDQSVSSGHRQYFIRSSFNASIRTRRSRRSSRRILRQSGRHTSTPWRQLRHVRFQPVPQAIDISITSSNGFEHQDDSPSNSNAQDTLQTSDENNPMDRHHRLKAKVQQQLTRFCRKSRIQFTGVKPKFSAKPLQHLPGHIKSSFGKIKLKTLNNLASQLQNTLTHHHHNQQSGRQQSLDIGGDTTSGNNNTQQTKLTLPIQRTFHLRNSAATAKHQITLSINNQKVISPADLEKLRSRVIFDSDCENNTDQQQQSHQSNDDDGWGSDFDESQSTTGADETTLNSITGAGGGSYLLEIGKPSCDTRAICDVIQDQGISGQFKRLHDVSCIDHPPPSPQAAEPEPESTTTGNHSDGDDDDDEADQGYDNRWQRVETCREDKLELITDGEVVTSIEQRQLDDKSGQSEVVNELSSLLSQQQSSAPKQRVVSSNQIDDDHDEENVVDPAEGEDDDAAEEEAELRSLEARQNFKQVRDKLKLILEQRLASYERDLKATRPHPASGASSSTTTTTTTSTTTAPAAIPVTSSKPAEQKTLVPANKSSERVTSSRVPPSSSSSAPKPPPPPPLPRKPTFVAGFNSHKQLVVTSQHRPTVHVNHDHFDCQSNCSEASSLSSGGLDSNHSGSQDSGHSTQHSADDGGRSTTTTTTRASRTVKLHHHKQQQQQTSISPTHSSDSSSPSTPAGGAAVIVVVANHHCVTGTQSESAAEQQQQQQALSSTAATTRYPLDAATRMRLLEQQRQMSVKLKQKPRRRTAKRALNLECSSLAPSSSSASPPSSASSACNGSLDNQSISTSTSGEPTESTTTTCSYPHHHLIGGVPSSAKSALSLRELIKEVIDNSEKPGKISRLTRSILTRSDSLSSSQEDEGSAAGCRGETGEISSSTASDQEKP